MCYNCGCHNPTDDMGHPDNITEETLNHLSMHWGTSLPKTKKILFKLLEANDAKLKQDPHLVEMFEKAARAWGQSVEEAKKNTHSLLKDQVDKQV